jgi:hypothetical protein
MSEQYTRTEDLRAIDVYPNVAPSLIDRNHSTYYLQDQGNAIVQVEKYLVEKKYHSPSTLGTSRGRGNPNQYLIKEDSFTDIGGGYATFLRHYAQLPEPWYDFEEKTALVYEAGNSMGLNYDSFFGNASFGNYSYGQSGATRRNTTYLAKATRYYVTKPLIDIFQVAGYTLSGSFAGSGSLSTKTTITNLGGVILVFYARGNFTGSFLRPNMLDDNIFLINNSTLKPYPARLYLNAPMGTIQKDDSRVMVVAPDRIRLWQPNIYEITRYTSSINLIETDESERIPLQIFYAILGEQNLTQEEFDGLQVEFFDNGIPVSPLTLTLFKDLVSDADKDSTHEIKVKVTSTGNNFGVLPSLLQTEGATLENITNGLTSLTPFTEGSLFVKWDTLQENITITLIISKFSP